MSLCYKNFGNNYRNPVITGKYKCYYAHQIGISQLAHSGAPVGCVVLNGKQYKPDPLEPLPNDMSVGDKPMALMLSVHPNPTVASLGPGNYVVGWLPSGRWWKLFLTSCFKTFA
ncbi:hypothetical protein ACFL6S_25490 [Candidatus Poribacteria bacterium]